MLWLALRVTSRWVRRVSGWTPLTLPITLLSTLATCVAHSHAPHTVLQNPVDAGRPVSDRYLVGNGGIAPESSAL